MKRRTIKNRDKIVVPHIHVTSMICFTKTRQGSGEGMALLILALWHCLGERWKGNPMPNKCIHCQTLWGQ